MVAPKMDAVHPHGMFNAGACARRSHRRRNWKQDCSAFLAVALLCCRIFACAANGAEVADGKLDKALVIDHGLAPDGRCAVLACVPAQGDKTPFRLVLADAKTGHLLDTFGAVKVVQDTGAKSFHAAWSPDSTHVIIYYPVDEHITDLLIYRLKDGRAEPLATPPDLIYAVPGAKTLASATCSMFSVDAHWVGTTRFVVRQVSQFTNVVPRPAAALRRYVELFTDDTPDDSPPPANGPFIVAFSAEGTCELTRKSNIRVVTVHPMAKRR